MTQIRYFEMADSFQLMQPTWAKVGIRLNISNVDENLFGVRREANEFDAAANEAYPGYKAIVDDPRWLFATGGSDFAPLWSNWYEGQEPQEEPPGPMKLQMQIYREEVQAQIDRDARYLAMKKIIEIARDEFWTMGISLPPQPYMIVKDNFHNVPKGMWLSWKFGAPGPTNVCQYFIDEQ